MDILSLVLLGITGFYLLFGILFGLKRGLFRSIARLVTLGVAFAVAWFGKPMYVAAVLDFQMDGQSLRDMLGEVSADMAAFAPLINSLVEILLGVVLFILVFLCLKFVTAIINMIVCIFVPKKSSRSLGMLVGAVQGLLIAFCICAPLNGIILDVNQVLNIEIEGQALLPAETKDQMKEAGIDFDAYAEGPVSKVYTAVGTGFYKALASTKTEDGKTASLSGYVEAATATTKFAEELTVLGSLNFENGLTADGRDAIQQAMQNLNAIKSDLSDEAAETLNDLVSTVLEAAGEDLPESVKNVLDNFDVREVNFETEGAVILDLYSFAEDENSDVTATDLVNSLAETTVILPVLESMVSEESAMELPEEMRNEVIIAINSLSDEAKAASLRKIFGLN